MAVLPDLRSFDLRAILLRTAELDVRAQQQFGNQFVSALARELSIDRLTHSIVDREGQIQHFSQIGMTNPPDVMSSAGKLIQRAISQQEPIVLKNVREHPDLTALWADDYRTNSCAVFPMIYRNLVLGALCLSNLTEKQVLGMQMQRAEQNQFIHLAGFITALQVNALASMGGPQGASFAALLG
jgi:GAF domain-containing protein